MSAKIIIIAFFLLALCSSCAEIQPLTGGERDSQPPRLDSSHYSTPNKSINFKEKEIILTFDEWIQLDQAQNKVLISPPPAEKPIIKLKHKSLVIKFKEDLRENTTYTINLGDAVKDLSEGNVAKNFNFVFSTGAFIDSLQVKGSIVDAKTSLPKENIWVMLYDQHQDSVPMLQKPYYITKTNKEGLFLIDNVKSDSFKIFALADKNSNYLFDAAGEEIGFWTRNFRLTDSTQPTIQLQLFLPKQDIKILSQRILTKGVFRIVYNQAIEKELSLLRPLFNPPADFEQIQYSNADSTYIWLKGSLLSDSVYRFANANNDTLNYNFSAAYTDYPAPILVAEVATKGSNKSSNKKAALPLIKQQPQTPLKLFLNTPIASIDSQKVLFFRDTILDSNRIAAPIFAPDSGKATQINAPLRDLPAGIYQLVFLPNAINNFFGKPNTDTLLQTIQIMKPTDYGRLQVNLLGFDSLQNNRYIFQLMRGKDEIVYTEVFDNQQDSSKIFKFENLAPAAYSAQIIFDNNKNNRWDTGDYLARQQPERVLNSKPISVRADWDNELEVNLIPDAGAKGNKGLKKLK
jgi:hypothetical protein